jgi:hypothetical protein
VVLVQGVKRTRDEPFGAGDRFALVARPLARRALASSGQCTKNTFFLSAFFSDAYQWGANDLTTAFSEETYEQDRTD